MAARPTPGLRGRREGSRTFNPATPGARRPKRPLLEGQTPALCIEPDDPEVPVGLAHRFAVADLQARHASVTLDRHDLAIHGEDFLGSFAFRLPHGGDGRQTLEGLLKGGGLVGRLGCEQLGEHLGARRSPSSLVQRNPRLHPSTVHPATLSPVRSRRPGNASDLLHAMNGTVAELRVWLSAWAPWLTDCLTAGSQPHDGPATVQVLPGSFTHTSTGPSWELMARLDPSRNGGRRSW